MENMEKSSLDNADSIAINLSEKDSLIIKDICEKANKIGELSIEDARQIVKSMVNFCYMNDRIGGYSSELVLSDDEVELYAVDVFNSFMIHDGLLNIKDGQIGLFKGDHPLILGVVNWKDGFDTSEMISELQKMGESYFDGKNRETFLVSENYIIGNYQKYHRLGIESFTSILENFAGEDILSNYDIEYECGSRGDYLSDIVYVNSSLGLKYFCSEDEYGNKVIETFNLNNSTGEKRRSK